MAYNVRLLSAAAALAVQVLVRSEVNQLFFSFIAARQLLLWQATV